MHSAVEYVVTNCWHGWENLRPLPMSALPSEAEELVGEEFTIKKATNKSDEAIDDD